MMPQLSRSAAILLSLLTLTTGGTTGAFMHHVSNPRKPQQQQQQIRTFELKRSFEIARDAKIEHGLLLDDEADEALSADAVGASSTCSRRHLMMKGVATLAASAAAAACTTVTAATAGFPTAALAAEEENENIPMLSTDEFLVILRDSARSIQRVEFSGPLGETVRVRLIDGTVFGLNDIIESPTDPRSPLKIQAACREAKVPFKNLQIEAILSTAPKKTKMYTNQRVQDAAVKEKERLERLARDEEQRLAELFKMEQEEAMR